MLLLLRVRWQFCIILLPLLSISLNFLTPVILLKSGIGLLGLLLPANTELSQVVLNRLMLASLKYTPIPALVAMMVLILYQQWRERHEAAIEAEIDKVSQSNIEEIQ